MPLCRRVSRACAIGLLLIGGLGCDHTSALRSSSPAAPAQPPWFADVTAASGIDFEHDPGPIDGKYFMPQINGSGAALLDCDNDGRLDLYLLQFGGPNSGAKNVLYRQLPSGKFENASAGSGLDFDGHNLGVAIGDVNNDGWQDVVVTQYLGVKLLLGRGKAKFADASSQSQLANPHWGASASFLDFDRDGWLDLTIVNYVDFDETRPCTARGGGRDYCLPSIFLGTATRLWRNLATDADGKWLGYQDVTDAAGLGERRGPGMGVLCADLTADGWCDILVANDLEPNHLWVNQHDGTFLEEGVPRGLAYNSRGEAESNMGVAYGDVDGNGLADLFITHFTDEHHGLWTQAAPGSFQEQTIASGLSRSGWHGTAWGTVLGDFDQEGSLDIALVNGFVQRRDAPSGSFWSDYQDRNQLFANDGDGHFRDISLDNPDFSSVPNVGRGLCCGDLDGDGALDLVVTQIGGPARIYRNVAPNRGHWLLVRAVDPALQRDAIGAEIRLESGSRTWEVLVQPSQSFQCANDPRVHFGLGSVARIERIAVIWPDGSREQFPGGEVDRVLELRRGSGQQLEPPEAAKP